MRFILVLLIAVAVLSSCSSLGLVDAGRHWEALLGALIAFVSFRGAGWVNHHYC